MLAKEKKVAKSYRDGMGETFEVRSSKVGEFINFFSGVGSYLCQCTVHHSYTPYVTDLLLLEIQKSNIVTSLREYNVMLYLLELWYNRALWTEFTLIQMGLLWTFYCKQEENTAFESNDCTNVTSFCIILLAVMLS